MRQVKRLPVVIAILAATPVAAAAPGGPVTTFGAGGVAFVRAPNLRVPVDPALVRIVDRVGALYVATQSAVGGRTGVVVTRRLASGAIDPAYGAKGLASIRVGPDDAQLVDIGRDRRGRVVVLMNGASAAGPVAFLARLTTTGALDRTFGRDGAEPVPMLAPGEVATGLAVLRTGGMAVVATRAADAASATVIRLNVAGRPLRTFARRGLLTVATPEIRLAGGVTGTTGATIAAAPSGDLVVATIPEVPAEVTARGAIVRLDRRGRRLAGFGVRGVVTVAANGGLIAVDLQGRVAIGIGTATGVAVERLTTAGRLDRTFGAGGRVVLGGPLFEPPLAIAALGAHRTAVVARTSAGLGLVALDAQGREFRHDLGVVPGYARALVPAPNGGFWFARTADNGGPFMQPYAARFTARANLSRAFAHGDFGLVAPPPTLATVPLDITAVDGLAQTSATDPGAVLVAGIATSSVPGIDHYGIVIRLRPDGRPDPAFGSGGEIEPFGLVPGGSVRLGAISQARAVAARRTQTGVDVAAFLVDTGRLDPGFGGGIVHVPLVSGPRDVFVFPDGNGGIRGVAFGDGPVIATFHIDHFGGVDGTVVGTPALALSDVTAVMPRANVPGELLVTGLGAVIGDVRQPTWVFAIQPEGSIDPNYGNVGAAQLLEPPGGFATPTVMASVAVGATLVGGGQNTSPGQRELFERVTAAGLADTTYGTGGYIAGPKTFAPIPVGLVPSGGAMALVETAAGSLRLRRLHVDGSADQTFLPEALPFPGPAVDYPIYGPATVDTAANGDLLLGLPGAQHAVMRRQRLQ